MKHKAQAVSEYVLLIAVIAAAVTVMQIYFRRSINSVVKIAADQVGRQGDGAAEVDYIEWREKSDTLTFTSSGGTNTEEKLAPGAVRYGANETSIQYGGASYGLLFSEE
jgi:hypothetical protein